MVERRDDAFIRDRLTVLEVKFDNHASQMDSVVAGQKETNEKLDTICLAMAEARGASKFAKLAGSAAFGLISLIGGFLGGEAHGALPK